MNFKKVAISTAASVLLLSSLSPFTTSAHAATRPPSKPTPPSTVTQDQPSTENLTSAQIVQFNNYVSLNPITKKYSIKADAYVKLSKDDLSLLSNQITETNKALSKVDPNTVTIVSPSSTINSPNLTFSANFVNGKTAIYYYWWGARIYLSRSTLRYMGAGATVGGIWIPEPLASKIVATLGVAISLAPGGIRFDVNVWWLSAGIFLPTSTLGLRGVSNVHWQ